MIARITWIAAPLALAGGCGVGERPVLKPSAAVPLRKPNILYVFCDQLRASSVGDAGQEPVQTPRLDRFAAEAAVFTTAVSPLPVCTPYRAALLAAGQIALWKDAATHFPVPIHSCLGNHDIWGGKEPTTEVPAEKAGAVLMVETLGMPHRWHSFDHGSWHIVALDSMSGLGAMSAEQIAWLEKDLAATPRERPVCVLSHLPIVSVTSSLHGDSRCKGNSIDVPGSWQHADCWVLSEIFREAATCGSASRAASTRRIAASIAAPGASAAEPRAAHGGMAPNTDSHRATG